MSTPYRKPADAIRGLLFFSWNKIGFWNFFRGSA